MTCLQKNMILSLLKKKKKFIINSKIQLQKIKKYSNSIQ